VNDARAFRKLSIQISNSQDAIGFARHCERSEAIHFAEQRKNGLLPRLAPRNDVAFNADMGAGPKSAIGRHDGLLNHLVGVGTLGDSVLPVLKLVISCAASISIS
jgi:hypothetical protein